MIYNQQTINPAAAMGIRRKSRYSIWRVSDEESKNAFICHMKMAFLRRCLCKVSVNEVDLLLATECPATEAVLRLRLGTISTASQSSIAIALPGSSMVAPALVNAFYKSVALSLDFVGS